MRTVKARLFTENTINLIKALRVNGFSIVDDATGNHMVADGVVIWFNAEGRQYVCPCFTNAWFDLRPLGFEQDAIHMASVTLAGNINTLDRGWAEGVVSGEGEIAAYIGTSAIWADFYHGEMLVRLLGGDNGLRNWDFEGDELNMFIPGFEPRNPVLVAGEAAKGTLDKPDDNVIDRSLQPLVRRNKLEEMVELLGYQTSTARQEMFAGHRAQQDTRPLDKLTDDELVERYLNAILNPDKGSPILKEVMTRMGDRPEFRDRILGMADRVGVAIPDVVKNMSSNAIEGEKPSVMVSVLKDEDQPEDRRKPEIRVLMSNEAIIKRLVGPWDGEGWDEGMSEETRLKRIALAEAMGASPESMQNRRELSPIDPESMRDVLSIFPMQAEGVKNEMAGEETSARRLVDRRESALLESFLSGSPITATAYAAPYVDQELVGKMSEDDLNQLALFASGQSEFKTVGEVYNSIRKRLGMPEKVVCTSAQVAEGESVFDADGKRWTKVHGRMVPEGMVQTALSSIHLDRDPKPFPDIGDPLVTWESIENLPGVKELAATYTQEEIQKAATWMRNEAGPVSEAGFSKFLYQILQVHNPKMTMHPFGYMTGTRDIESNIFSAPVAANFQAGLEKLYDSAVEHRSAAKALKYPESVEETRSATRDLVNTPSRKLMGSDFEGVGGAAQARLQAVMDSTPIIGLEEEPQNKQFVGRLKLRPEVEETINRFADPESVEVVKAIVNKDEPKN